MIIKVSISECLSSTQNIEVPDDFEYDPIELKKYVKEQVALPSKCVEELDGTWDVDDFCVL